ncbi:unnamed protein product [Orchesella dallaii]|uniref:O-acyltransferase WSD1 C-terminal domain-containing protein n=1 Tax=Orchesella dallaii TaxID=48710 RepID=A0ABP1RJI0_9HEXA
MGIPKQINMVYKFLPKNCLFEFICYFQIFMETTVCLLILLLSLPFSFYRWFVIQFVFFFRKDLGKILSPCDLVCDNDQEGIVISCSNPIPKNSILFTLVLDGILKLSDLQFIFKKNVIDIKKYPQLKQYPTNFMGYRFWKQDDNFNIENHVVQEKVEGSLSNLHENLLNRPFLPKRSPWELVLIQNQEKKQTILGFRISHTMSDVKSAMKLLCNHLGQQPFKQEAVGNEKTVSLLHEIFKIIPNLISFMNTVIRGRFHPWKNFNFDEKISYSVAFSPSISLPDIKVISKKNNASGSSVIMASITGAIHNLQEEALQCKTLCWYPLLRENHPDTEMKNHFYITVASLPVNEPCREKRLKECHQMFTSLRKNYMEKLLDSLMLIKNVPGQVRRHLLKNEMAPTFITNNLGSKEKFNIGGIPVVQLCGSFALLEGSVGVGFFILSYGDELNISVICKGNTVSRTILKRLANGIGKELEMLKELEGSQKN